MFVMPLKKTSLRSASLPTSRYHAIDKAAASLAVADLTALVLSLT